MNGGRHGQGQAATAQQKHGNPHRFFDELLLFLDTGLEGEPIYLGNQRVSAS